MQLYHVIELIAYLTPQYCAEVNFEGCVCVCVSVLIVNNDICNKQVFLMNKNVYCLTGFKFVGWSFELFY